MCILTKTHRIVWEGGDSMLADYATTSGLKDQTRETVAEDDTLRYAAMANPKSKLNSNSNSKLAPLK